MIAAPKNKTIKNILIVSTVLDLSKSIAFRIKHIIPTVKRPSEREKRFPTKGYTPELFSVMIDKSGITWIP